MKIKSRSAEQLAAAARKISEGDHRFQIAAAVEKDSAAGNRMIELTAHILNEQGEVIGRLRDWLTDTDKSAERLRNAAVACGLLSQWESGELNARDFVGKEGRCRVIVKKSKQYGEQNRIADYLTNRAGPVLVSSSEPRTGTTS